MRKLLDRFALCSIAARLTAMAIAGAVFMVFVAVTVLFIAGAERIDKMHAMFDAVWNMADGFQHAAESGAMTEASGTPTICRSRR